GADQDVVGGPAHLDGAAPEAVAPIGGMAIVETLRVLLVGAALPRRNVAGTVGGIERIAGEEPLALVVARSAVAVEEAVLVAQVLVISRDAGRKAALVVVARTDALHVQRVDRAILVVVDAITALEDLPVAH